MTKSQEWSNKGGNDLSNVMHTVVNDTREKLKGTPKEQSAPGKGSSLLSSVLSTSLNKKEVNSKSDVSQDT